MLKIYFSQLKHFLRTVYYTTYDQVTVEEEETFYECCTGWSRGSDAGCNEQICGSGTCFHGGHCNTDGQRLTKTHFIANAHL